MKKILIILTSVTLFSCLNKYEKYHIDETTSPTDTLTFLKSEMTPLNGMVYCKYGDNGLYINGKRDGEHKRWYDNGQLKDLGNYDNGKFINYQSWYENGNRKFYHVPKKDTLYEVSTWFESGQLKERYTKKNGKWEGEFREWSEDGQLLIISNYSDNKLNGEWKQYFYDGNYPTVSISNFKNNERVGETIYIDL